MNDSMLEEVTNLIGRQVYSPKGFHIGEVKNIDIDVGVSRVDGICLVSTNDAIIEHGENICVPYRWIQDVGDIIILRYFPDRVSIKETYASEDETVF